MPTVSDYMTRDPLCIQDHETLLVAHAIMRKHRIRHLPVLDDSQRLVGVVSERDLHLLETLHSVDPRREPVSQAMTEHPYSVSPGASLAQVAQEMQSQKYGSAVVVEGGRVVGLFTTTDALRALAQMAR